MLKNIQKKLEYLQVLGIDIFRLTREVPLEKLIEISEKCEHNKVIALLSVDLEKNTFFLKELDSDELVLLINQTDVENLVPIIRHFSLRDLHFFLKKNENSGDHYHNPDFRLS